MKNFRASDMPKGSGTQRAGSAAAPVSTQPVPRTQPQVHPHPPAPDAQGNVDEIPPNPNAPEPEPELEVPHATTPVVLAWVNGDKARAQAAYDKEQTLMPPRKGLSSELLEIINAGNERTRS